MQHPNLAGVDQYMSSDFLVDTSDEQTPGFALQAKYKDALLDARTVEKLELKRRYWQAKGVLWYLITEQEVPAVATKNIQWLPPAMREEEVRDEPSLDHSNGTAHYGLTTKDSVNSFFRVNLKGYLQELRG
nr:TnsA endonuclease N-terminal domain-containing protein [Pseudovibrio sp. WM33]